MSRQNGWGGAGIREWNTEEEAEAAAVIVAGLSHCITGDHNACITVKKNKGIKKKKGGGVERMRVQLCSRFTFQKIPG